MLSEIERYSIIPVGENRMPDLLEVYRQCEDFLALGPTPTASEKMIRGDLDTTRQEGGIYCGIFDPNAKMIGVLDVVPSGFQGNPRGAFIELLMLAAPYRGQGLGSKIIAAVEDYIMRGPAQFIQVAVQINNPRARYFWERQGYTTISEPELQADGTVTVMMRKERGMPVSGDV